jgi:hypothetical protein
MPGTVNELPSGVQSVAADAPIDYIIRLLKRDGGVFIKNFVSEEDADKAYSECRNRIDNDMEWEGDFFPSESSVLVGQFEMLNRIRGDAASAWLDWTESYIHEHTIDAPIVSRSLRPFSDYKKHVLVGQ